jgi:2-iminobutanoate/2-iminopropanoate deaminase
MPAAALASAALPRPRFFYSQCVRAAGHYHVAGMIALDSVTGLLEPGGPGAEAAKILANLKAALGDFGLRLDDMVSARIFTTEFDRFAEVDAAWEAALAGIAVPPARTSVGVMALPLGASVEIEFSFYKDETL